MAFPPFPPDDRHDRHAVEDPATAEAKALLRARSGAAREALDPQVRRQASTRIGARLEVLRAALGAVRIGVYAATREEVDVDALAARWLEAGLLVAYPRVEGPAALRFHRVRSLPDVARGPFGIREPGPDDPVAERLELLIVPGLAFDVTGGRVGYGRGYYDRYLAGCTPRPLAVGVGFAAQVVPTVPRGPHDVDLDAVVTEDRVYR